MNNARDVSPQKSRRRIKADTGEVCPTGLKQCRRDDALDCGNGCLIYDVPNRVDNYGSHKHLKVRTWLDRHPRFVFHYTPKSASWLNAVEGFFAKLTRRRLKRGAFRSLVDPQAAIKRFLAETNDSPKPFVWTADPDQIIAAVRRGYQVLDSIH